MWTPISTPPQPWWEPYLNYSVFNFASPALERLHQARRAATASNLCALFSAVHMLASTCVILHRVCTAGKEQRALLSHSWSNLAVVIWACSVHMGLILLAPSFTRKHRRAVRAAFLLILTAVANDNRAHVLWMRYVAVPTGPSTWPFSRVVHSFFLENITAVGLLLGTLTHPISPLTDILLATVFLATNLGANRRVCELPYMRLEGGLVSLSTPAFAVARAVSEGVCDTARAALGLPCSGLPPSCDAVLGFWQVAAWYDAPVTLRRTMH